MRSNLVLSKLKNINILITRKGLILGMGNPLLDMMVLGKEDLLQKYGLDANNACLAEEKHQPLYQELVDKYEVEYIAGGAVQNSLRVTQVLPSSIPTVLCHQIKNINVYSGFYSLRMQPSFSVVLATTNLEKF